MKQEIGAWYDDLKSFNSKAQTGHFPGKQQIQQGLILLADLLQQSNSFTLIERSLEQSKVLEDFAEDFEDLDDFYKSQFQTWQALINALNDLFKANRPALEKDPEAKKALDELDRIYNLASPYDQLRHINPLIEQIQKINKQLVLEKRQLAQTELDQRIERVQSALKQAAAPDDIQNKALRQLQLCKQRISQNESIPQIVSDQSEAAAYEDDAYELINRHIEGLRQKESQKPVAPTPGDNKVAEPAPKRTLTISQAEVLNTVSPKGFIETQNDIDLYLNALRERLAKAVNAGDRVRIR
jgi:DNA repair ATPase RecN